MSDPILKTIPTFSSLAVLSHNLKYLKRKKHKPIDLVEQGVGNIVGIQMTREIASFV